MGKAPCEPLAGHRASCGGVFVTLSLRRGPWTQPRMIQWGKNAPEGVLHLDCQVTPSCGPQPHYLPTGVSKGVSGPSDPRVAPTQMDRSCPTRTPFLCLPLCPFLSDPRGLRPALSVCLSSLWASLPLLFLCSSITLPAGCPVPSLGLSANALPCSGIAGLCSVPSLRHTQASWWPLRVTGPCSHLSALLPPCLESWGVATWGSETRHGCAQGL